MVRTLFIEKLHISNINTKTTVPLDVVPNDAPRDFGPEVAFGAKFWIPVARQGGRELSAPRPCVTNPFYPLSAGSSY